MSSPLSARQKALRLQRKIFRSLKAEASLLLGETPPSIRQYEKENQQDFKNISRICSVSKSQLIEAVQNADVTFIADFHTFDQAQRTALRIMRKCVQPFSSDQPWYLGLELIPSQFQLEVDRFQADKLSLKEFHEAISYDEHWGFPWRNYAPLFEWAKENHIRIIALNRPLPLYSGNQDTDLDQRDQWAAGIITDLFNEDIQKGRQPKMIALYGELHVGTRHLPKQLEKVSKTLLKKPLSWITLHQNQDRLYWRLAQDHRELETEIVKLKKNVFCILSSTPWTKLQSLVSWIEGPHLDQKESDLIDSDFNENGPDYLSLFQTYGTTIAEFLGLPTPSFEEISLYSIANVDYIDSIRQSRLFSSLEMRLIQFHITYNQRIFIPRISAAYLGSPSQNGAAELAAIHLIKSHRSCDRLFSGEWDDFYRLILEFSFGFFGSLILNPRRKCDSLNDHITRIEKLKNGEKLSFPQELEARQIVVGILQNRLPSHLELKKKGVFRKHSSAIVVAAKYLGQISGKKLHQAILRESVTIELVRDIFFKPNPHLLKNPDSRSDRRSEGHYESRYEELFEILPDLRPSPSQL